MSVQLTPKTEQSEDSHSSQAYVSLAQLTDGGEAYCTTLEVISRERRLDFEVADHAKEITREEQMQPSKMSATRLKSELMRRNLYTPDQPTWALVICLEEAVRKESRILRLHQATTQVLIKPSKKNRLQVKKVIGESKKQYRSKRINQRATKHQQSDEVDRRKIKQRSIFFSLPQLDREYKTVDKSMINDGIFILNMKKEWIHKKANNVPLKKDVLDEHYMTVSNQELYETLWRKEERGEVIWIKDKTYEQLNRKFSKITRIPREDDSTAKCVQPLSLKDFWWTRTWKKVVPLHRSMFTNSEQKILCALKTNCFEEMSLAEIVHQSNPALFQVWGVPTLEMQKELYRACKTRLPNDLGYGKDATLNWREAEVEIKKRNALIQKEEESFWSQVGGYGGGKDEEDSSLEASTATAAASRMGKSRNKIKKSKVNGKF